MMRWLTGALQTKAGPRASAWAKRVAHLWGTATSRWRMLPDFIVVGAQRSGTTTLYRLLEEHPGLTRPTFVKGTSYFDVNYHRGMRWYRAHFPLRFGGRRVTFENSGYYLFHPASAARIKQDLPNVRIVAVVRDPVERAYSAHRHELARGFESLDFEDAIAAEPDRVDGESERLMDDPSYESFEHRHHAYLARGRYAEQLQRFVSAFGRDHVYIMDADLFFAEPAEEFARLQEWLGLDPWRPGHVRRWNERPRQKMSEQLRTQLEAYFEGPDRELASMLERPPSWRDPADHHVYEENA